MARVGWLTTAFLVGWLALRVAYNAWWSPWELVADEALNWDSSRHLELSYYTKGPGLPWLIAGLTRLLGEAEWVVRLPAALSLAACGGLLSLLASATLPGLRWTPLLTAVIFSTLPGYHLSGLLSTIDGPLNVFWVLTAWVGWRLVSSPNRPAVQALLWFLLGLSLGVGALFKLTIFLIVPGLVWFALWERPQGLRGRAIVFGGAIAVAGTLVATSPMILWNAQRGWPMLAHTLGHLALPGGDLPQAPRHSPLYPADFLASQVGIMGPALVLITLGVRLALRTPAPASTPPGARYLVACALPALLFFAGFSFWGKVQGNWPLPVYATLVPLAAWAVERGQPPRLVRAMTVATGLYALLALGLTVDPFATARLPVIGPAVPLHRLFGQRDLARRVQEAAVSLRAQVRTPPLVIAESYGQAALLAYYMPGRPKVFCAGVYMGRRPSRYDYWPDMDLSARALQGRPAVLVGGDATKWKRAFLLDGWEQLQEQPLVAIARAYRGPRISARLPGVRPGGT